MLKDAPWRAVGWRDDDKRWELGVLDCYHALADLDLKIEDKARWLDVGSGNGLNAIPLALMFPKWEGLFVEKSQRKAIWFSDTLRKLKMKYKVLNCDVESLIKDSQKYDVVTARALFPPQKSCEILGRLLKKDGLLILFCGKDAYVECNKKLKISMHEYQIQSFNEYRKIIIATKL